MGLYPRPMRLLTTLKTQIVLQRARALVGAGVPVTARRVVGSRAPGHSDQHSDLDAAVVLARPPDPRLTPQVLDFGQALSIEANGQRLRVQAAPFLSGEAPNPGAGARVHDRGRLVTQVGRHVRIGAVAGHPSLAAIGIAQNHAVVGASTLASSSVCCPASLVRITRTVRPTYSMLDVAFAPFRTFGCRCATLHHSPNR